MTRIKLGVALLASFLVVLTSCDKAGPGVVGEPKQKVAETTNEKKVREGQSLTQEKKYYLIEQVRIVDEKGSQEIKVGYIDRAGNVVVKPQFDGGEEFSEGLAVVCLDKHLSRWDIHTKYGYIDTSGSYVVKAELEGAYSFSEGLGRVSVGNKYGFIDKDGKWAIKPQFVMASDFSEGLAVASAGEKRGYIDKSGKFAIDLTGRKINGQKIFSWHSFCEGLAEVRIGSRYGKCGFIDNTGKVVIKPVFTFVGDFSEGLAPAAAETNGALGYIDKTGKFVIEPQFQSAYPFSEGLACVEVNGKYGFIDKKGNMVIQPRFDWGGHHFPGFSEGLSAVPIKERWGYINRKGEIVIQPRFGTAYRFEGGLAEVWSGEPEKGQGYINKKGQFIWRDEE